MILKHYGKKIEVFLPHVMRFISILEKGYRTQFTAKDTHYYWALDENAMPDHAPVMKVLERIGGARVTSTEYLAKFFKDLDMHFIYEHYAAEALIYAQGAVFPTIPGKYTFPRDEGYVIVTSNQKVVMKTAKNGTPYYSDNPQPCPETWSGQMRFNLGFMELFQFVMPFKYFKWRAPPSFEPLRNEKHRMSLTTNVEYGPPSEATSPLDFYLLKLIEDKNARMKTQAPNDHKLFESDLRARIESAEVSPDHYIKKVMELALVTTSDRNHWGLFRDYSRFNPHSVRIE